MGTALEVAKAIRAVALPEYQLKPLGQRMWAGGNHLAADCVTPHLRVLLRAGKRPCACNSSQFPCREGVRPCTPPAGLSNRRLQSDTPPGTGWYSGRLSGRYRCAGRTPILSIESSEKAASMAFAPASTTLFFYRSRRSGRSSRINLCVSIEPLVTSSIMAETCLLESSVDPDQLRLMASNRCANSFPSDSPIRRKKSSSLIFTESSMSARATGNEPALIGTVGLLSFEESSAATSGINRLTAANRNSGSAATNPFRGNDIESIRSCRTHPIRHTVRSDEQRDDSTSRLRAAYGMRTTGLRSMLLPERAPRPLVLSEQGVSLPHAHM